MITIETLLRKANELGASDLHITVGVPPKCRINGELVELPYEKMLPSYLDELIEPIISEHFKEILMTQGEVDFSYSISMLGRYRVNIFRQRGSYAIVIRLVGMSVLSPEDLGIPPSVIELTKKKKGLVLVTGPGASGRTTTLASLINVINTNYSAHIITLEDPVEYLHNHKKAIVNQREIGLDTNSYAAGLRAAIREDPDVILVGEMCDIETIPLAIAAVEAGHLVFSTMHTIGAEATIERIIEVFPPQQQQQIRVQLSATLEAVVSQQLIPTADGTKRAAAFEVMHMTPAIKNLIQEGKTQQIPSVLQSNKRLGMQTMDDAIYELYLKRIIDSEKAMQFAQDPSVLERKLF